MSPIHELIDKINESSSRVLNELDNESPSFDKITAELNEREYFVNQLGDFQNEYPASSFDSNELGELKNKFNIFSELNKDIQNKAKDLLLHQKEKLATATKNRKAEDQYKISGNPNISYF